MEQCCGVGVHNRTQHHRPRNAYTHTHTCIEVCARLPRFRVRSELFNCRMAGRHAMYFASHFCMNDETQRAKQAKIKETYTYAAHAPLLTASSPASPPPTFPSRAWFTYIYTRTHTKSQSSIPANTHTNIHTTPTTTTKPPKKSDSFFPLFWIVSYREATSVTTIQTRPHTPKKKKNSNHMKTPYLASK